jgi:hypothetical protein
MFHVGNRIRLAPRVFFASIRSFELSCNDTALPAQMQSPDRLFQRRPDRRYTFTYSEVSSVVRNLQWVSFTWSVSLALPLAPAFGRRGSDALQSFAITRVTDSHISEEWELGKTGEDV